MKKITFIFVLFITFIILLGNVNVYANSGGGTSISNEDLTSVQSILDFLNSSGENNWVASDDSKYVSDVYGADMDLIHSGTQYIIDAFQESENKDSPMMGCGPIAIINQLLYLRDHVGYYQMNTSINEYDNNKNLSKQVFDNTNTIPVGENIVDILNLFLNQNKTVSEGVLTLTCSAEDALYTILNNYNLSFAEKNDYNQYVYSDESLLTINRVTNLEFRNMSFDQRINLLKNSIDRGMPIIGMFGLDFADFSTHYVNISGYQYFVNTSDDEQKLYFKVNMNFPEDTNNHEILYMDSEYFTDEYLKFHIERHCAFIFIEEKYEKCILFGGNHNINNNFYNDRRSLNISTDELKVNTFNESLAVSFHYKRAAGFTENQFNKLISNNSTASNYAYMPGINNDEPETTYCDKHLLLSPNKSSVSEAYIEYEVNKNISEINIGIRWLTNVDSYDLNNGKILLQYKNLAGEWTTYSDLLSEYDFSTYNQLTTNIHLKFKHPVTSIRLYSRYFSPYISYDGGRFLIDYLIFYGDNDSSNICETFNYLSSPSSTHHYIECECGMSYQELHSFTYQSINNNLHIEMCSCGYTINRFHVIASSDQNKRKAKCIECGYLVDLTQNDTIVGPLFINNVHDYNFLYSLKKEDEFNDTN